MKKRAMLCGAAVFGLAASGVRAAPIFQTASPYTDPQGDGLGSTNGGRDIVNATFSNDATNLYVVIELNPTSTTNPSGAEPPANIATASFNYGIGITTGPGAGGDTSANATTHGNPYTRAISIDSSLGGMTDWIGIFGAGGSGTTGSPFTSYGFNDYVFGNPSNTTTTANAWTKMDTVSSGQPISMSGGDASPNTISLTIPMSDFAANLALTPGTTFDFDIYTTGNSGAQTAYDSLADQLPTQTPATFSATAQYNGTVLDSYTIQAVPEPALMSIVGLGSLALLKRRNKA